jgi:hypothetical protein
MGVALSVGAAAGADALAGGGSAHAARTHAHGTLALAWPQPPAVLQAPSRSGPEGPPPPFGVQPPPGPSPPATPQRWVLAQDRALEHGPFPHAGLRRGVSDGALVLNPSASVRALAFARIRQAGATIVRIPVDWRATVQPLPAARADLRDPASPAYRFAPLDAVLKQAAAAGLTPLIVVSDAPAFAEAPGRWRFAYPGTWAPNPEALESFGAALAKRYDGSFSDPGAPGRPLPRVHLLQAWNEPNLARYLEPQWVAGRGRWIPFSPRLYREMLNGFYAGVTSVAPADVVLSAGVAPNGDPAGTGRMAPVSFLRTMMCVGASRGDCPRRAHFDALAFHPLSFASPDAPAVSSEDVSIADAGKVTALLRRAERTHSVLGAAPKRLWVTELNWESAPPARSGVPEHAQPRYLSRALHRMWLDGVAGVDWQFLVDPYPALVLLGPRGEKVRVSRPAGLYSPGPGGVLALARPKPFLRAFSLPFDPIRIAPARVRAWALLMRAGEPALLERRRAGRWRPFARVHADRHGVLNVVVQLARAAAQLRLRCGGAISAAADVAVLPRAPARRRRA